MPINICLIYPQRETPFIWTSVLIKTLNSLFHKTAQQNPRTLRWWGRGNDLRSATLSPLNQTGMTHALEKQLLIPFSTSRLTMWGYNNNAKKNMNVNAMQCAASARPDQAIQYSIPSPLGVKTQCLQSAGNSSISTHDMQMWDNLLSWRSYLNPYSLEISMQFSAFLSPLAY